MSTNQTEDAPLTTSRCIFNDDDMKAWKASPLKADLLRVVAAMGKSCANVDSSYHYDPQQPLQHLSPAMASLHGSLTTMSHWCPQEFPPLQGGGFSIRFGNPAFKSWHSRLVERSLAVVQQMHRAHQEGLQVVAQAQKEKKEPDLNAIVQAAAERGAQAAAKGGGETLECEHVNLPKEGSPDQEALLELSSYMHDAFGHPIRLDYGTGHESSFMVVLYAAVKLGWMHVEVACAMPQQPPGMDRLKAATISIFSAYLKLTRQLQLEYRLEPAGSHGVWGLDDYHCLPFYFGACQCQQPSTITGQDMPQPSDITRESCRTQYADCLLYLGCMDYICTLKQGAPLFECSPMLYDISQTCLNWSKVAAGLIKLYEGEVLNKRQVVQHFTFGKHLFVATWAPSFAATPDPPTTNFRQHTAAAVTGSVGPMVRAPWATDAAPPASTAGQGVASMGRASWANSAGASPSASSAAGDMPPPTKAPWAK